MPFPKLKKLYLDVSDLSSPTSLQRVLNALQESVAQALAPLSSKPHLDSQLLTNVSLTAGSTTQVAHRLGRPLSGWKVVRMRAQAVVWEVEGGATGLLALNTSADVVVDLEVF